jgi:hypothetical protein
MSGSLEVAPMSRRFRVALTTFGLVLASIGVRGQRTEPVQKKALVELFTSQG